MNVLTLLRLAGFRPAPPSAPSAHPLVVIGGAVTFVNPEPLALFADVIAAGEGEATGSGAEPPCLGRERTAPTCSAAARAGTRLLRARRSTSRSYADDGTLAGYVASRHRSRDAPLPVRKAALKTTEAVDPPATGIFTPDTEFGSRFLIEVVRGCANLCRFCWAGYNYLPVRAFPDRSHPAARRAAARRIRATRRPRVDRALRPPGHRAHPGAAARDGLLPSARRRCGSTT